ncbi:MAG: phosphatase PAP2 family protein [bacterium]|nr:phosphatase PAP2 family protein [bacterium]
MGRNVRMSGAVLVCLAIAVSSVAANELGATLGEAGFDLRPSIDRALADVMLDDLDRALGDSDEDRRVAAAMLAAPSIAGAEGRQNTDESTTVSERQPGNWLIGGWDRTSKWVTAGIGVALAGYLASADDDEIAELGDITQILPLATALGLTIGTKDWDGLKQLSLAGGTSFVLTHGIKETTSKMRPDATTANSFPSGHTSASVTGAAFIWRRYGAKWGAPASLFAAYTGVSRMVAERHFGDDVISGMAVGLISNWLFTNPIDERVQLALFPTQGGASLQVSIDAGAQRQKREEVAVDFDELPRRIFVWEMGGAWVQKNNVVAPNPGGDPIDFQFGEENDPTTTATVGLIWSTADLKHDLYAYVAPFEIREVFEVEDPFEFAGARLDEGVTLQSRYLAYDYRAGYSYALVNTPDFRFTAGASFAVFETDVALSDRQDFRANEHVVMLRPTLDLSIDASLSDRWLAYVNYSVWSDSEVKMMDATAQLVFRLSPKWALSLGYRRVERRIDVSELYNQVDRNQTALGVWYIW